MDLNYGDFRNLKYDHEYNSNVSKIELGFVRFKLIFIFLSPSIHSLVHHP